MSDDAESPGRRMGRQVLGDKWDRIEKMLVELNPDLAGYVRDFAYGEVYARPGLGLRERELISMACLAVQRLPDQLKTHVHGALNAGVKPDEIREAFIHMALYAGFPTALAGLKVAEEVIREVQAPEYSPLEAQDKGRSRS